MGNSHLVVAVFIASYLLLGAVPPTLLGAVPPASTSVLRIEAYRPAAPLLAPILAGTVPLWPNAVALATAVSSAALGPVPLHPQITEFLALLSCLLSLLQEGSRLI